MIIRNDNVNRFAKVYTTAKAPVLRGTGSAQPEAAEVQFDQVNIKTQSSTQSQFQKELVAKLVGEVRTANTTSSLQSIKEAIAKGSYQPDAAAIAAKFMLED